MLNSPVPYIRTFVNASAIDCFFSLFFSFVCLFVVIANVLVFVLCIYVMADVPIAVMRYCNSLKCLCHTEAGTFYFFNKLFKL